MEEMEKRVKYPIGLQDFEGLIEDGFLYVDKTGILYDLINGDSKYIFLSRPRRFGKSLTLSTLKAFFEGKKELFKGLKIYDLEKDWKKHPVFLISFARFEKSGERSLENILDFYFKYWEEQYGLPQGEGDYPNRFAAIIRKAVEVTGEKAVVLIDEYDSALVSTLENQKLHERIKTFLKPVYTVLKDLDSHIRFALLTGITRFSRMSIFSGLNNLQDISMDKEYAEICGITQEELENYFKPGIKALGQEREINYDECLQELKAYYDGYHFTRKPLDIYNPFSILNALKKSEFGNYWFATGIPSFIVERMKHQDLDLDKYLTQATTEGVLMEADKAYSSDVAILFQAGFLTIKGYDMRKNLYTLGLPNREVREGMSRLFMEKFLIPNIRIGENKIFELNDALEEGDPEKFLAILKAFFAGVPFDMSKGDKEVYYHNAFYIVTNLLGLRVQTERHIAAGSIDLVASTPEYVYVFEFKLNKKAQEALDQINSKGYTLPWSAENRKVFKIGVRFSSRARNITDWIIE